MTAPTIGIFALQGDVREHARALEAAGCDAVPVRRPAELARVDGLVLPGGESTTMIKLARTFGLLDPLRERIGDGLPVYGSCAGMILLADRVDAGGSPLDETIGGLDITVRRNAFGRQVDSFEEDVDDRRRRRRAGARGVHPRAVGAGGRAGGDRARAHRCRARDRGAAGPAAGDLVPSRGDR